MSIDEYFNRIEKRLRKLEKVRSKFEKYLIGNKPLRLIAAEFCRLIHPLFEIRPDGFCLPLHVVDEFFCYQLLIGKHNSSRLKPVRDELKLYGWKMTISYKKQRVFFEPIKKEKK